jgi:biotin carboxylase
MAQEQDKARVLVLASAHSYRMEAFLAAAERLGVEVVRGVDVPPAHVGAGEGVIGLDFKDPARALRQVQAYARQRPLQAVIPTDDGTVSVAAHVAQALGLAHNSVAAAEAARDKLRMRQALADAGVRSPWFLTCTVDDDPLELAPELRYPCVIKPTCLSGSRGVMRVNDEAEFVAAFERLRRLLSVLGQREVLVEGYLPGAEYALEGILRAGSLSVLAIFDKPDPLEGPFFEESIYVTPSRAEAPVQAAIAACVSEAAAALGLREGAVHAEVRVNAQGAWLIEAAGRSIGGLCSQVLRFAHAPGVSLEELILRQALGRPLPGVERERAAGGVMMIPIPQAGILAGVRGLEAAQAVPGIESIEITARVNYPLVPLPEGESYLGFIFARAGTPAAAEAALRAAHRELAFDIEPALVTLSGQS